MDQVDIEDYKRKKAKESARRQDEARITSAISFCFLGRLELQGGYSYAPLQSKYRMSPEQIWIEPDNKNSPDYQVWLEWKDAYNKSEDAYKKHVERYLEKENRVTLRALSYSCLTKGTSTEVGTLVSKQIAISTDDGYWRDNNTFFNTETNFGNINIQVLDSGVDLPESEPIEEEPVLRALAGPTPCHAFLRFTSLSTAKKGTGPNGTVTAKVFGSTRFATMEGRK